MLSGSDVTLRSVGVNPTRSGVFDVFAQVGIPFELQNAREELGEPVADIVVRSGGSMHPFSISGDLVPRLIDELPVLAVLATHLNGVSTIRDAAELRVKESDRISKIAAGLRVMGARVETYDDGLSIEGPVPLRGSIIDAEGDHRIAMAFAIAGLTAEGQTIVEGAESIATSYPGFESDMRRLRRP
jgi:3-phosphoshikimate 1-carboxyvinyltransferase